MLISPALRPQEEAAAGPPEGEDVEGLAVQRQLHRHYTSLLAEPEGFAAVPGWRQRQEVERIERAWVDLLDARVARHELPDRASQFEPWYFAQAARHTELIAGLTSHLEGRATLAEMATFFAFEEKVDSKFDDLMALAQLGTSGRVKLAIGENYWDEMGEGDPRLVHTTLFDASVTWMRGQLGARGADRDRAELPEVYANANQLLMYGLNRRYAPRLLGALGVLEQTASRRFRAMVDGCVRLGVPADVIAYQRLHVGVDHDHGAEWFEHVLAPLVRRSGELLGEICRGVLTRCEVAVRYYETALSQLLGAGRAGSP
ncbi:MAG TPA: iron-containing redox enzyme family protein [Polyangiaceae bacterium]|nr:iron-containing redox enzyme family protein [Polyangiaceae bacterium]